MQKIKPSLASEDFGCQTSEFLRSFGVRSLEELPTIGPVQVEEFKAQAEEEVNVKLDI